VESSIVAIRCGVASCRDDTNPDVLLQQVCNGSLDYNPEQLQAEQREKHEISSSRYETHPKV
jgi:hypothetical protein